MTQAADLQATRVPARGPKPQLRRPSRPRGAPLVALALLGWGLFVAAPAAAQPAPIRVPTDLGHPWVLPAEPLPAPLRPLIDSHVHLWPHPAVLDLALHIFAENGVTKFVVKNAGTAGSQRLDAWSYLQGVIGHDRMAFYCNLDWEGAELPDFGLRAAMQLEECVRKGGRGLKIFKSLGLGVTDADGQLLAVDDRRLDPLWVKAAELNVPIALHISDPEAFFEPPLKGNERWEELQIAEDWSFYGGDYPLRETLLLERDNVLTRHPRTTFLNIHLGNCPEHLEYVDALLARHPNLYIDTSARLGEIGRHPREQVRAFFIQWQDRILFGTDLVVTPRGYQLGSVWPEESDLLDVDRFYDAHRRFFETDLSAIDHPTPIQGNWTVDAIGLPPDVLEKLYVGNAERLIFQCRPKIGPFARP